MESPQRREKVVEHQSGLVNSMYAKQNERRVLDTRVLTVTIRKGPKSILVEPGNQATRLHQSKADYQMFGTPLRLGSFQWKISAQ
jgi:hypothetical protein